MRSAIRLVISPTSQWRDGSRRRMARPRSRGEPAASIATALRYSLMSTSIRSVAGSIPPVLLVALVRTGCWTAEKGVAYARQDPSKYDRARTLSGLVPFAPESLLEAVANEALSAVREIGGTEQAELMAVMFRDLPDAVLRDAVAVTRAIAAPPTDEATEKVRDAWLALVTRLPVPDALATRANSRPSGLGRKPSPARPHERRSR